MAPADTILEHYRRFDEDARLRSAFGEFEFARLRELIEREFPPPPLDVLDLGGGTGAYAFWLASRGYRVHLVDIVPSHIERASVKQAGGAPTLASLAVGDARELALANRSMDAVLLAGPLYHLTQRADRVRVLAECGRVLKDGGTLAAVAINRYAGLIYGLTQGLVFDPHYLEMTVRELSTGVRVDPPPTMNTFLEAYFHLPGELLDEMSEAGFECGPCLGAVGPSWIVPKLEEAWADERSRAVLLSLARLVERECVLSPQLFCAARRRARSQE